VRPCISAALAAMIAAPLLLADQVILDNGDRVTGKITKKDGDSVTISSDLMGAVTIKWAHVKSIATDAPVTVVLTGGKTVEGKLVTSGDQVEVAGQTAPLPSVTTVRNAAEQTKYERFLHPPLYDLWAGYYDLGIAAAAGNSETLSITNALTAARVTNNDKLSIYANQIYAKGEIGNTLGLTAQSLKGGWAYNRNTGKRSFVSFFDDYVNDKFQNLRFRGVFGGGGGFHPVATDRTKLDLAAGFSLDHESYSEAIAPVKPGSSPAMTRNSGEIYWGDDLIFKVNKASSLTQSFRMFNNVSDTGEYRMNFNLGMATKIAKWLSWQITASDNYITDPVPGKKTNDLLISSGIRVTFTQLPQ
jgi:putative salt-induced outer membrane protein YdiY